MDGIVLLVPLVWICYEISRGADALWAIVEELRRRNP